MRLARATTISFVLGVALSSIACHGSKRARDASVRDGSPSDAGSCTLALPALATRDLVARRVFPRALAVVPIPGTSDLAIVQQTGLVEIVRAGAVLSPPFLDLTSLRLFDDGPSNPGEQGLLGLAFHPDYASNGRFFVAYTLGADPSTPGN